MSEIIDVQTRTPEFAIVGYKTGYNNGGLSFHQIDNDGRLAPEQNLSRKAMLNIFAALESDTVNFLQFKGFAANILYARHTPSDTTLIWKLKKTKRRLSFSENHKEFNGVYNLPKLVFIVKNTSLYVYAYRAANLTENTPLYHAPFFNVYANGEVCTGNVDVDYSELRYFEDVKEFMENGFFNSRFTHTNHDTLLKINIVDAYKKLCGAGMLFNDTWLVKTNKTLKQFI